MIALNARLSSISQSIGYLRLAFLICTVSLLFPTTASADLDQQAFGHLALNETWHGDFDGMVDRRLLRVLVVPNKIDFFIDRGQYRGVYAELVGAFEKFINRDLEDKVLSVKVIFLPVTHDRLLPALLEGKGDIAVGNLTVIDDRLKVVDFSKPFLTDVNEIVVAHSKASPLGSMEDLAGKQVYLRKSSSYYFHALELNEYFKSNGLAPLKIVEMDEHLEDSDLLELVNKGVISMTVVDSHTANVWKDIYEDIRPYGNLTLNESGEIGWAFRKNSPMLAEVLNSFVETSKKGTELGNLVFDKYLNDSKWTQNVISGRLSTHYELIVNLLKKYAEEYDFDYLMTKAIAFQESKFNHTKRSPCGAVGIMQLLPETAADKNVGIPNIENIEENVHAGHRYLRFIQDRYFTTPEIDYLNKHLLTFAAYNAGPRKIIIIRNEAKKRGLDPNVWFNNVEVITAEKIGRETVHYVNNIYKYYISYRLAKDKADKVWEKSQELVQTSMQLADIRSLKASE